jgi:hypothetical protein
MLHDIYIYNYIYVIVLIHIYVLYIQYIICTKSTYTGLLCSTLKVWTDFACQFKQKNLSDWYGGACL